MPSASTILVFAAVTFGFTAVPGPSSLFVLGRGLSSGSRAAVAGAVGCATGALFYVVATAAGLSALLASSQPLFRAVHYAGAAYLVFLGVRAIRSPSTLSVRSQVEPVPLWTSYRQGLATELLNPKVALFFLALFPQFLSASRGAAWSQVLVLGAIFVAIGLTTDSCYAIGSGAIGRWLRRRPAVGRWQNVFTGLIFIGLGAWAALTPASANGSLRRS